MPYLPLWSGLFLETENEIIKRQSNAPVECWFKEVKQNILDGERNLRCNRFIEKLRVEVLSQYKQIILQVDKKNCARGPKTLKRKAEIDEGLESVEKWKRKMNTKKRKHYFVGNNLDKIENEFSLKNSNEQEVVVPQAVFVKRSNGLCVDPNYYKVCPKFEYVVASFKNCHSPIKQVMSSDYSSLVYDKTNSTGMWLTNFVVDVCLHIVVGKIFENTQLYSTIDAQTLFLSDAINFDKHLPNKVCLFPLLINSHWILISVDCPNKKFSALNPISTQKETNQYFKKFLAQKQKNTKLDGWTCEVNRNHAKQKDSYNCGIFIIQFAERIAKGENLIDLQPCDVYRTMLQTKILEESDDMTNNCLACGMVDLNETADWVQCETCDRWLHIKCLPADEPHNRYSLPNVSFTCPVCKINY